MSANQERIKCQNCGKENANSASFCSRCGTSFGDGSDPLVGKKVGTFLIEKKIGAGGSGTVYQGSHAALGKRVAIKVLRADLISDEETKARFDREARVLASMEHPNIVSINDFGYVDGVGPYMVMEWLEGLTLFEGRKQRGYLTFPEIVRIFDQLTDALSFMHQRGIVHRDLKPENMMLVVPPTHRKSPSPDLTNYWLKLYDFGIALFTQGDEKRLTAMGMVVGTPHYMAPEQIIVDAPVDHRADLYALGAILFELLTGRPPFWGVKKPVQVMESHLRRPPPSLREVLPQREFPVALEQVLRKALSKNPQERYQDARLLFEAINLAIGNPNAAPIVAGASAQVEMPNDFDRTVVGGSSPPPPVWENTQQLEPPSPDSFYDMMNQSVQPPFAGAPTPAFPPQVPMGVPSGSYPVTPGGPPMVPAGGYGQPPGPYGPPGVAPVPFPLVDATVEQRAPQRNAPNNQVPATIADSQFSYNRSMDEDPFESTMSELPDAVRTKRPQNRTFLAVIAIISGALILIMGALFFKFFGK